MAKYCGKCGAKLNEVTGLCPNCDAEKIKQLAEKHTEPPKEVEKEPEIHQQQDTPLSKKEAKEKRKTDKKSAKRIKKVQKKAAKKEKARENRAKLTTGQKVRRFFLKQILWLILLCAVLFVGYKYLIKLDIQISEENLRYDETQSCYYLGDQFTGFSGSITGTTFLIDDIKYEIADANSIVVSGGEIPFNGDIWTIPHPGMMIGVNTLRVSASMKIGNTVSRTITVVNTSAEYLDNTTVNINDSDGDGLIDYYEDIYKTDPNNPDSDGDGLSDYVECVYTGTDPTLYSTENDGICDADRDSDGDGLSNIEEIHLNIDPGAPDSDGDGLSDSEEYSTYSTDPLSEDTDGDGATDAWEIAHNYDPLVYNKTFEVYQESTASGSPVSAEVTLICDGNPEGLYIEPISVKDLLDETMVGYLGSAYSFTYGGEFSSATITMTFTPELLADNAEPTIYYYNEETQLLEELETTIDGNMASATVSHFSTYILLDRTQVSRIIEEDIVSPQEAENRIVNIAFVVDYSASMNDNDPEYMRLEIVKDYLSKLRENQDSATLVQFAGYATTLVPLTSDKEMLINAAGSISNTGSDSCSYGDAGTNGSDGLRHALDELSTNETATYRYIIFLTDGEDTNSSYSYDDIVSEAIEKNIIIYSVGMGDCDEELLSNIATATGGTFHYASTVNYDTDGTLSLKDIFEEIEKETVDYYADSNNDGISDYYTRLICEGLLTTGTGANPFGNLSYDEIQSGGCDYDGDGLANGEEISISQSGEMIYLKYRSSPILPDTDHDGFTDDIDGRCLLWDVGDRDLAVFADLTYIDGSSLIGKMYSVEQIEKERAEGIGKVISECKGKVVWVDEPILKSWDIVDNANWLSTVDFFSATAFKCQDNIVISYRGTDEISELLLDDVAFYGLCNHHTEEVHARNYARRIVRKYPDCNIYITGHSLGGYLAQIGTAELLENTDIIPKRVAYFNGMGMNFIDYPGVTHLINTDKMEVDYGLDSFFHLTDMTNLTNYALTGGLISYEIEGDIVSALGTHCGKEKNFKPAETGNAEREGENELSTLLENVPTYILSVITKNNIPAYYSDYSAESIVEYIKLTHLMYSFYYNLDQGTRSVTK